MSQSGAVLLLAQPDHLEEGPARSLSEAGDPFLEFDAQSKDEEQRQQQQRLSFFSFILLDTHGEAPPAAKKLDL